MFPQANNRQKTNYGVYYGDNPLYDPKADKDAPESRKTCPHPEREWVAQGLNVLQNEAYVPQKGWLKPAKAQKTKREIINDRYEVVLFDMEI